MAWAEPCPRGQERDRSEMKPHMPMQRQDCNTPQEAHVKGKGILCPCTMLQSMTYNHKYKTSSTTKFQLKLAPMTKEADNNIPVSQRGLNLKSMVKSNPLTFPILFSSPPFCFSRKHLLLWDVKGSLFKFLPAETLFHLQNWFGAYYLQRKTKQNSFWIKYCNNENT